MKKYNFLLLVLMSVLTLGWTSCTDSVDYIPTAPVEGQGVYFSKSSKTAFKVSEASGNLEFNIYRTNKTDGFEAPLIATVSENGKANFELPSSVTFASGADNAVVKVPFKDLTSGAKYDLTFALQSDSTAYGNNSIKLSVSYSNDPYTWEVVSKEAVFIEGMFTMFGLPNFSFLKDFEKPIVVEKAKDKLMYRFKSPYDNEFFTEINGGPLFPDDFEIPYIILDGEKFKELGKWLIPKVKLGFQFVNGEGLKYDPDWVTFGSFAVNLSTQEGKIPPTSEKFPLGTYDEKSKSFNFGKVFHNIGGYGPFEVDGFKLFLDQKLLIPDFDRDFTWKDVDESEGQFISELAGNVAITLPVQCAKEDPTFYRVEQLYSEEGSLYFYLRDGLVTMPKKQKTGMHTFGNPVYMEGTPGKSSYDPESKEFKLGVTFYLADKEGNKKADLISGVEEFLWGHNEIDRLTLGKSIDDYVGSWDVPVGDLEKGELVDTVTVTAVKVADNMLAVKGLGLEEGYNDVIGIPYDAQTGLLSLKSQSCIPHPDGQVFFSLLDSSLKKKPQLLYQGNDDFLVGGFNAENKLAFYNNIDNKIRWNSFAYMIQVPQQGVFFFTGKYGTLNWDASPVESAKTMSMKTSFKQFVPKANNQEFKVSLNKERQTKEKKSFSLKCKEPKVKASLN